MTSKSLDLTRRTVLKGVGVTMALPWLESLPVWGAEPAASGAATANAAASALPRRFAALFMGNGVSPNNWWAKGSGKEMELSKCLEPMQPFAGKMNVISGLFNKQATGVGIHPGQTGNILSGAGLTKGAVLHGGVSVDQVLSRHFAEQTAVPSLVLGCEQPITGYHESNFSMAYSSHISWQDANSPVPMEVYPSLAFDSLFDNHGSQRARSILDRVAEHARSLTGQVSQADRAKLDEYLTSVREVEKRIAATRDVKDKAEANARDRGRPLTPAPLPKGERETKKRGRPITPLPSGERGRGEGVKRPDDGLPEDIRQHMRLMCDIVALAFQTDKTRVATLLLCRDLSGLFYPFLDVRQAHHPTSHDDNGEAYQRVVRYYVSQVAYLAGRLAAMREGESTVLDNSCLMFLSNMWSGTRHDSTKLPILLVGSLGSTLETGRVLDYTNRPEGERKLCGLYLSLLERMGLKQERFGDAAAKLTGI